MSVSRWPGPTAPRRCELKRNGWWGNSAVAACYEGLPWFTGATVVSGAFPDARIIVLAALYSIGAHGIMTLNDFKSIVGDRKMGIGSLPVRLGPDRAARLACLFMALPQVIVFALLWSWGQPWHAGAVACLTVIQLVLMAKLIQAPREKAAWYNATGVTLYVLGMLISAFAVHSLIAGGA